MNKVTDRDKIVINALMDLIRRGKVCTYTPNMYVYQIVSEELLLKNE